MSQGAVAEDKLESWKSIAAYVGRDVRTVIRWEQSRGLPIHRVPGGGRQVVFAFRHEIDVWWLSAGAATDAGVGSPGPRPVLEASEAARDPAGTQVSAPLPAVEGGPKQPKPWWIIGTGVAGGLLAVAALAAMHQPDEELSVAQPTRITRSDTQVLSPLLSDGKQIYYPQFENGRYIVAGMPVGGGETTPVATGLDNPELCDVSVPGHALLLRALSRSRDELAPLYVQPVGGTARRVGDFLAYDGAFYPDGNRIVYSNDGVVFVTDREGKSSRQLFTATGNAFWFRWSADGSKLRFTVIDKKNESTSLWEFGDGDKDPHRLFPELANHLCCGNWAPNGKYYLFQLRDGTTFQIWAQRQLWRFPFLKAPRPFPLVVGATSYRGPLPSLDGKQLYVRAETPKTELMRYEPVSSAFIPALPQVAARTLAYSIDGKWFAYTSLSDNNLWRCRADGSECRQLTQDFKNTAMPRWSPDDQQIAFMGLHYTGEWGVYGVAANGGPVRTFSHSNTAQGDPDWSPDGEHLAFSEVLPVAQANGIHILDLKTGENSTLPGSKDYFLPRWSPDGRYLVASLSRDQSLWLYEFRSGKWQHLAAGPIAYPNWSRDSKSVYFVSPPSGNRAVFRVALSSKQSKMVADLSHVERAPFIFGDWVGLGPDDMPLATRNLTTEDIFAWNMIVR